MEKEIKITPPEGFEIDKDNSTFECIKFKPVVKKRWRDDPNQLVEGYFIGLTGVEKVNKATCKLVFENWHGIFASEKQAKSVFAMAQISQIMAHDDRFGGAITDEEWLDDRIYKYCIYRSENKISTADNLVTYRFLAFHTNAQRYLFIEENEDLIKDYLMID